MGHIRGGGPLTLSEEVGYLTQRVISAPRPEWSLKVPRECAPNPAGQVKSPVKGFVLEEDGFSGMTTNIPPKPKVAPVIFPVMLASPTTSSALVGEGLFIPTEALAVSYTHLHFAVEHINEIHRQIVAPMGLSRVDNPRV